MLLRHEEKLGKKLKRLIIGKAFNLSDPNLFRKLSLIALFAWIGVGADALSSSSYGPQEAFLALGQHTYLGIFVALFIAFTIFIISASYSQIIEKFPSGGGGYLVASKLLSPNLGMFSGCALLIDYTLTITVSIASGADALFSFLPPEWYGFRLIFAVLGIAALVMLNLRGVKESVMVLLPIFLLFLVTHVFGILYAVSTNFTGLPAIAANTASDIHGSIINIGFLGILFLILHSYSMGAGTYTGIEAVSNSMNTLREPRVKTGKRTMQYMAISLAFMVIGLFVVYLLYAVSATEGKTLNAVMFEKITFGWGDFGIYFVLIALFSEAALLFAAAQTGFVGGPRVLANMSLDKWIPTSFSALSERFVTAKGILAMGSAAIIIMILTQGSVSFLVVLYSITVFITFSLSQLGMVRYWWVSRSKIKHWKKKITVNGIGLSLTTFILFTVIIVKFGEGGWITLLITAALVFLVVMIKRYYNYTDKMARNLDVLVTDAETRKPKFFSSVCKNPKPNAKPDRNAKTAVILVNGFNGIGLEAVSTIFELFGNTFRNFIFVEVGVIDAGGFKGSAELVNLQNQVKKETERYVTFMKRYCYHAEAMTTIGIDPVEKILQLAPKILSRYPNAVFFGGQLIFKRGGLFSKMMHNSIVFSIEKKLFDRGIPFIIIPISV